MQAPAVVCLAIEDIDRRAFRDKRVSRAPKAARTLTRGPERTLRHEMIPMPPDVAGAQR
jgi:hypothetical protein